MNVQEIINTYFSSESGCRPLYQPVFGHPELNTIVENLDYEEKIATLFKLIKQFQTQTGKKIVHIFDIGSAE